jgi:uncharacterized protein YjlB
VAIVRSARERQPTGHEKTHYETGAERRYPVPMRDPEAHLFPDADPFPNSRYPVLVYRQVCDPSEGDRARFFEQLFGTHGWPAAWRAGLYTFHHFHSTTHEVLGVYRGSVQARLGGPGGAQLELNAGDVIVIPAGVAHCNEGQSSDFKVVGAYPEGSDFDMQYGRAGERPGADRRIASVPLPGADPVQGREGALLRLWGARPLSTRGSAAAPERATSKEERT